MRQETHLHHVKETNKLSLMHVQKPTELLFAKKLLLVVSRITQRDALHIYTDQIMSNLASQLRLAPCKLGLMFKSEAAFKVIQKYS